MRNHAIYAYCEIKRKGDLIMNQELKIAGELIAKARGEEQSKLLSEALKQWTWNEIKQAVETAEKRDK